MSQTCEERAGRKEVNQTPGISRYRTRSAYCLYPGNSSWGVRSSKTVRTTKSALMIMVGISPHGEPSVRGMPKKNAKLKAYPGCRMMAWGPTSTADEEVPMPDPNAARSPAQFRRLFRSLVIDPARVLARALDAGDLARVAAEEAGQDRAPLFTPASVSCRATRLASRCSGPARLGNRNV